MTTRSSGVFPREGYNLDDEMKATVNNTNATSPIDLASINTIRVIAIGKYLPKLGTGAQEKLTVTVGGQEVEFDYTDSDTVANLPPAKLAHIRGALCTADDNFKFARQNSAEDGGITVTKSGNGVSNSKGVTGTYNIDAGDSAISNVTGAPTNYRIILTVTNNGATAGDYVYKLLRTGVGDLAAGNQISVDLVALGAMTGGPADKDQELTIPTLNMKGMFVSGGTTKDTIQDPVVYLEKVDR